MIFLNALKIVKKSAKIIKKNMESGFMGNVAKSELLLKYKLCGEEKLYSIR
jgi:hypothetical protein